MEIKKIIESFLWTLKTEKRISLNTYKSYFYDLKVFSNWLKNEQYELNTSNILLHFDKYLKEKKNSESSINRKMGVLNAFFKYCNEEKEMNLSILEKKTKNRLKIYRPFLEKIDLEKMRDHLIKSTNTNDKRLLCIIEILYSTGMRVSELLKLKIIDFNEIKKNQSLKIIGKGQTQRIVFFTSICIDAIENYLEYGPFKSEYLFPFSRQRVFQLLKNLASELNIELYKVFPHSFRHRLLTDLVKKGMNLISVQKIAGHKQISTTEKYTHVEDYLYEEIYKYHPLIQKG